MFYIALLAGCSDPKEQSNVGTSVTLTQPTISPSSDKTEKAVDTLRESVILRDKKIVAEAKGTLILLENVEKAGAKKAIKDAQTNIITLAGSQTSLALDDAVALRIGSIIGNKFNEDSYTKMYRAAVEDAEKTIKTIRDESEKLRAELMTMADKEKAEKEALKAYYEQRIKEEQLKQKTIEDAKNEEHRREDQNAFRKICIGVAALIMIGAALYGAASYFIPTLPKRGIIIIGVFGIIIGMLPILTGQFWFPPFMGVILLCICIELYKYFKAGTAHLNDTNTADEALYEALIAIEEYKKSENITEDNIKTHPLFVNLSREMSPVSKEYIKKVRAEHTKYNK